MSWSWKGFWWQFKCSIILHADLGTKNLLTCEQMCVMFHIYIYKLLQEQNILYIGVGSQLILFFASKVRIVDSPLSVRPCKYFCEALHMVKTSMRAPMYMRKLHFHQSVKYFQKHQPSAIWYKQIRIDVFIFFNMYRLQWRIHPSFLKQKNAHIKIHSSTHCRIQWLK